MTSKFSPRNVLASESGLERGAGGAGEAGGERGGSARCLPEIEWFFTPVREFSQRVSESAILTNSKKQSSRIWRSIDVPN